MQLLPAGDASPGLLGPPLLVLSRRCACVADDIDAAAQPRNSPAQAGWVGGKKEQWDARGAFSRRASTVAP